MKRWTEEEVRIASTLRRSGTPVKAIAQRLNRTPGSVAMKLSELGITVRGPLEKAGAWATLAEEIALAKAEWATAPLYRPRDDEWMR